MTPDCMDQALIQNGWSTQAEILNMKEGNKKMLLYSKISFHFASDYHTLSDLSMRAVSSKMGSLCGISALYQAAVDTVLTTFQIKSMTYDDVKTELLLLVNKDPILDKSISDEDLLKLYHSEVCVGNSANLSNTPSNRLPVIEDQEMESNEFKSYGTELRYECGKARKFFSEEQNETYTERHMTCNWNTSWSPHSSLDPCVWVQCLHPPLPPALTNLALVWDGSPVNFTQSVSYVCREEGLYFERDRDMTSYNISCLPGGQWDEPSKWPKCIKCKSQELYTTSSKFLFTFSLLY